MQRSILCALVIVCVVDSSTHARGPEPIAPAIALDEARAAYRAGPTADRIRVTIHPDGKPARQDDFVVKVDPGKASDHADASVALEMGELRAWISRGQVIAAHQRDQKSCFLAEYAGPLTPAVIEEALPPIPIPEVWLMTVNPDPNAPLNATGVTPYTPVIAWESAVADDSAGVALVTINGHTVPTPAHPLPGKVTLSTRSGRLVRFAADLDQGTQLILDFEPVVPGDPRSWAIDAGGRARVPQVSDLKPRPGDVTVGTPVPELNFNDADRKPWNFLGEFAVAPGEPADSGADFLVLLLVCEAAEAEPGKPPPETSILEDAAAGERAVRALKARLDHDRLVHTEKDPAPRAPKLVARTVLIVRKADGQTLAKVRTGAAQWGDGLLWSVSRANTIDRFMPGADAAIIVIKPDRTVAGIIPLGGRSASQEAIGAELERVVIAAAPETPRK